MTDITEITNVLASIADGDLIYFGEDLGSSTYTDAAGTALTLKNYVLTGPLAVIGNAAAGASIRLPEDTDNGSHYVAIKAPDSLAATYTLTLPADDGAADEFLKTDGFGGLTWGAAGASAPLTLAGGTVTDPSAPLTITQTWNDAADTFTALAVTVTNTNSAAASKLIDLKVGADTIFGVERNGRLILSDATSTLRFEVTGNELAVRANGTGDTAGITGSTFTVRTTNGTDREIGLDGNTLYMQSGGWIQWCNSTSECFGTADTSLFRIGAGILGVRAADTNAGGALNFLEQTAPSAPGANQAVLYAEDNGSGKTRLVVRFPSGVAQVLATEP